MGRWWSDLGDRNRKLIITAAIAEATLKTAVLIDIRHRPASQIRGSKWMWIVTAVLVQLRRGRTTVILRLRAAVHMPQTLSWLLQARVE